MSTEEKIGQRLRKHLRVEEKCTIYEEKKREEKRLPKDRWGLCYQPDIIAFRRRANRFKFIECKSASSLRKIGQAFGQVLAAKMSVENTGEELINLLRKWVVMRRSDPKVQYIVAFNDRNSEFVKKLREDHFKDFGLYIVPLHKSKKIRRFQGEYFPIIPRE